MYTAYADGRGRPVSGSSRQSTSVVTPTPPSPRPIVQVGAAYEYEYDDEDDQDEDEWPPSVSQRRLSAHHHREEKRTEEDGEVPGELDQHERVLRKARSLERTRTWAEEVARQRRKQDRRSSARHVTPRASPVVPYDEADTGLLGLGYGQRLGLKTASSIIERHQRKYGSRLDVGNPSSSEGDSDVEVSSRPPQRKQVASTRSKRRTSETSTVPSDVRRSPRAAHPSGQRSPTAASPLKRMAEPEQRPSLRPQVLSIDEIIRKHSPAAQNAEAAIVTKARLDLGLSPKPSTPVPVSPVTPLSPTPLRTPRPGDNSTLAPLPEMTLQQDSPSSSTRVSARPNQNASEISGESEELVLQDLEIGQQLLDKLERGSLASSGNSGQNPSPFTLPRSPTPQHASRAATPTGTPNRNELSHALARYLRSSSLNRILTLPRPFPERPLRVSLAELGDLTGKPVLVFLGLGCARHLIAMYDDLAKALGLRLICIDRWGYGKTDPMTEEQGSIMRWAWVVEQVMDRLEVDKFQVMAHSAGAAYAVAVVLRIPERVKGTLYFLAPWVSTEIDGGYKWLKWVPNTVIKSATAAEHRLQTYFLGKPPPLTYKPIGYTAPPLPAKTSSPRASPSPRVRSPEPVTSPTLEDNKSSKSPFSRSLGRAASKRVARQSSTLGLASTTPDCPPQRADSTPPATARNGTPASIKGKNDIESMLHESPGMSPRTHSDGVLPTRASLCAHDTSEAAADIGLPNGFDTMGTSLRLSLPPASRSTLRSSTSSALQRHSSLSTPPTSRSPSLAHRPFSMHQAPSTSPAASVRESEEYTRPQLSGAMLLALEQASHAESEPGSTHDLLTVVLGRQPWGFSYTDLPPDRHVRVYWGKEDDRVSEKGVRWLERNVSAEVVVLPGEGHGLMSRGGVVFDVLKSMSRGEE